MLLQIQLQIQQLKHNVKQLMIVHPTIQKLLQIQQVDVNHILVVQN